MECCLQSTKVIMDEATADTSEEESIEEGDEGHLREAVYVQCGGNGSFCGKVH